MGRVWNPPALPGAHRHLHDLPTTGHLVGRSGMECGQDPHSDSERRVDPSIRLTLSTFQLCVPVRIADKLLPAVHSHIVSRIGWTPVGPLRDFLQPHSGLLWSSVCLGMVTRHACQYTIVPSRLTSLSTWQHVVDRQHVRSRLLPAVLTHEPVSLENVPTAERDMSVGQSVKSRQGNNLRNANLPRHRSHTQLTLLWPHT